LKSPIPALPGIEQALDLYRGDFLDDFSLPDGSQFDDWAEAERERYRLMAIRGWGSLARRYESSGDLPRALETFRRALSFDTLQEDLHRDLMRLLYKNGDRSGMIRQYETLCDRWIKNWGCLRCRKPAISMMHSLMIGSSPLPRRTILQHIRCKTFYQFLALISIIPL
jgi:two-component SAPR family response regulator